MSKAREIGWDGIIDWAHMWLQHHDKQLIDEVSWNFCFVHKSSRNVWNKTKRPDTTAATVNKRDFFYECAKLIQMVKRGKTRSKNDKTRVRLISNTFPEPLLR